MDINKLLKNNPVNTSRGAPMGDPGYINDGQPLTGLNCQKLGMVDYCYGPDGVYWGGPGPSGHMYVVFNGPNDEYKEACGLLKYVRAHSRNDAIDKFNSQYPGYSFAVGKSRTP